MTIEHARLYANLQRQEEHLRLHRDHLEELVTQRADPWLRFH